MALVSWSGGIDSTLVLLDLAKKSSEQEPVRAVSFVHAQIGAATESTKSRTEILKVLRGRGYHIKHTTVNIALENHDFDIPSYGLEQAILWVSNCVPFLEQHEDLHIGWIRGDHAAQALTEARWAFDYLQRIGNRTGKLVCPLINDKKAEIIKQLDDELLNLCWTCEHPIDGKSCGECEPCITRRMAIAEIEFRNNISCEADYAI